VRPRVRLALLREDLRRLGADDERLGALPRCVPAASLCRDAASAAGSLYVLEGSTLGGRIINRRLAAASWYPASGLRYWDPHGDNTGSRWKETLADLESLPAAWSGDIAGSAVATFEILHDWLVSGAPGMPAVTMDAPSNAR
jgi:heme oxygenase